MENRKYTRKEKNEIPVLAICYDFDKTLSPDDMQAQGLIQKLGCDPKDFWDECNKLRETNDMDDNLAYMYLILKKAGKFKRNDLASFGSKITFFKGVEDWFKRIKAYGKANHIAVEHYIISSGLKEMIESTTIYKNGDIDGVYACSFFFDEANHVWPAQIVNYTDKTQYLFRIEKGIIDINDKGVNDAVLPEDLVIPFYNMVYIGDSDTDIPCMELVNERGGFSIGVYDPSTGNKTKVYKMMRENRIKYFAPADYTEGSQLDQLIKAIIKRTAMNTTLEQIQNACQTEFNIAESRKNAEEKEKENLIAALEDSYSFKRTHEIIQKMLDISSWDRTEKDKIFKIALTNRQVFYVLRDTRLMNFFGNLVNDENLSKDGQKIKKVLKDGYTALK